MGIYDYGESHEIDDNEEYMNKTSVSAVASNDGLVATFGNEAIRCCIDIYMNYHVSEVKKMPKATQLAWEIGQKAREYKKEGN